MPTRTGPSGMTPIGASIRWHGWTETRFGWIIVPSMSTRRRPWPRAASTPPRSCRRKGFTDMRLLLPLTLASLTLAGCVYGPAPAPAPQPLPVPPITEQVTPAMRAAPQQVVSRELANRLPGVNVAPDTTCGMQNAHLAPGPHRAPI